MKLTKWRGTSFSSINMYGGMPWETARGQWTINWGVMPRGMSGPILTGGDVTERIITADFMYTGTASSLEVAFDTLLGFLDPLNDEPGALTGERLDGTEVVRDAVIRFPPGFGFAQTLNSLSVEFVSADPRWYATSATTVGPTTFTADGTLTVNNTGLATVPATFTVRPTSNAGRVGLETPLIGWKYQAPITITNNSDEDWHEVLWPFWWGDTTGLTTTKALASGADVRIWRNGQVIRRQLICWDSSFTQIMFPVTLKRGKTATYWVTYGNPQASTSATLDPEYLTLDVRGGKRNGYAAPDLANAVLTATGGTLSTFVVSGAGWEVDRLAGGWLRIVSGVSYSERSAARILSNTADTLSLDHPLSNTVTAGDIACVWMSGIAITGGLVSSTTTTSLTDAGYSGDWATDQWENAYLAITAGTGIGAVREITSSDTSGTLNWSNALTLDTTSRYIVVKPGYQSYMVNRAIFDTAWRGLWRITNYYESPKRKARYGDKCPGAFTPFVRYQNEDNFAQPSSNDYGVGGGHSQNWFPNGRIRRQVRQDRHYGEHKQADGFSLTDPRGIDGVEFDYEWKNVGGICQFTFGAQTSQSTDYMDLVANSTTQASLTAVAAQFVNLTGYDDPVTTVAFNNGPVDGVLIPNTTDFTNEAEWRTRNVFRVWVSPSFVGGRDATYGYHKVGAEEQGYDVNTRLKRGTQILQLGGAGRHLLVTLNEDLVIRTDPDTTDHWAAIYASGVLQDPAPWALRFLEEVLDLDANAVERAAETLLALPPGSSDVAVSETAMGSLSVSASFTKGYLG